MSQAFTNLKDLLEGVDEVFDMVIDQYDGQESEKAEQIWRSLIIARVTWNAMRRSCELVGESGYSLLDICLDTDDVNRDEFIDCINEMTADITDDYLTSMLEMSGAIEMASED